MPRAPPSPPAPPSSAARWRRCATRGFQGITLRDLLSAWAGGPAPWARPVVLTFDDGLRSVAAEAAPILRDVGFRATVFVVAGRGGGDNQWPGQAAWAPRQDLLTAADLSDLCGKAGRWARTASPTPPSPDLDRSPGRKTRS